MPRGIFCQYPCMVVCGLFGVDTCCSLAAAYSNLAATVQKVNCSNVPSNCAGCSFGLCFDEQVENTSFCASSNGDAVYLSNASSSSSCSDYGMSDMCGTCNGCDNYQGCLPDVVEEPLGWAAIGDRCQIEDAPKYSVVGVNFTDADFSPQSVNSERNCVAWQLLVRLLPLLAASISVTPMNLDCPSCNLLDCAFAMHGNMGVWRRVRSTMGNWYGSFTMHRGSQWRQCNDLHPAGQFW